MPQVTFKIYGLAVCYRGLSDSFWTIVFPHDGKHKAMFTYKKKGMTSPAISVANKDVSITAPGSSAPSSGYKGAKFDRILNMTASYLHGEGVIPKDAHKKMTIEHAVLDSYDERDNRSVTAYQYDNPLSPATGTYSVPFSVSYIIGGKIEIPPGGKVVVGISGVPDLVSDDSFVIDNFCGDCDRDFLLYHTLFKNRRKPQKICDVTSIPSISLNKKGEPFIKKEAKLRFGTPPSFCDGVVIDPAPGP